VSRASHRKPKLPRFNIGVASDDEDNGELQKHVKKLYRTHAGTQGKDGCQDSDSISKFQVDWNQKPETINPSPAVTHVETDLLNINVTIDETDTSFAHFNLEELGDSILLNDSIPDISMVSGSYGSIEDSNKSLPEFNKSLLDSNKSFLESNKSLLETVLSAKPTRDPKTKKPLNSKSVIVSGSKQEKCWLMCRLCPEKFASVQGLEDHLQNAIHVVKKFNCDLCGRKFAALRDVERHRRIHTGERPFTCDICCKSFARKDNLKAHKRQHLKNSQGSPECIKSQEST